MEKGQLSEIKTAIERYDDHTQDVAMFWTENIVNKLEWKKDVYFDRKKQGDEKNYSMAVPVPRGV